MARGPKMTWETLSSKEKKTKIEKLLTRAVTLVAASSGTSESEAFAAIEAQAKSE